MLCKMKSIVINFQIETFYTPEPELKGLIFRAAFNLRAENLSKRAMLFKLVKKLLHLWSKEPILSRER